MNQSSQTKLSTSQRARWTADGCKSTCAISIALFALVAGGCPPLQPVGGGTTPDDGSIPSEGGDTTLTVPVVSLSVSNPVPQVNEEVTLQCRIVAGDTLNATFDYQPADFRLVVDRSTGLARILIDQSSVAEAFTFRCTATTAAGTSAPSNSVLIIPSP